MSEESKTPKTDEKLMSFGTQKKYVRASFSRQLETELADCCEKLSRAETCSALAEASLKLATNKLAEYAQAAQGLPPEPKTMSGFCNIPVVYLSDYILLRVSTVSAVAKIAELEAKLAQLSGVALFNKGEADRYYARTQELGAALAAKDAEAARWKQNAEGTRLALKRLNLAIAHLGQIKDGKTLFEHRPSHDDETLFAWLELNEAQRVAKIVIDAAISGAEHE